MIDNRTWERWDDPGVAEYIDRYWLSDRSSYETIYRSILSKLIQKYLLSPTEKVLEVGSGSGLIYGVLVPEVIINSSYIGVDTSSKMLEIARKRFPMGQFIRGDAYGLQFASNSFDIVICFEVLGHLPQIQKPIGEFFRVARRLVIFTVWTSPEDQTLNQTEEVRGSKFLHNLYSQNEIVEAIREAANGEPYAMETRILSDTTWAYIIFKSQVIKTMNAGQMSKRILPFQGLTDLLIQQQIARNSEIEEIRTLLQSRENELEAFRTEIIKTKEALIKSEVILREHETEVDRVKRVLNERKAELEQAQIILKKHEDVLGQMREALGSREAELGKVKAELESHAMELMQTRQKSKEELAQLREALGSREAELGKVKAELESHAMELMQTQATLKSREGEIGRIRNKGKVIVHELDLFRHRKVTRLVNRVRNKSNAWNDISPAFQQLKDDSLIFNKGLNSYRLQPSINLLRVSYVFYPLNLNRPNLKGILLAPILDLPLTNGKMGIEIVAPSGNIAAQCSIQANQINESIPTRFDFLPIPDTNHGRFWLRVFVRDVDAPMRIFEWRKYVAFGLGPLQTRAFCGFLFENTP